MHSHTDLFCSFSFIFLIKFIYNKKSSEFFKEKTMTALKGIIAPFTTPFKANGEIDLTLIKPQVDWLIENGVHGLAAGGSTGAVSYTHLRAHETS